MNHHESQDSIAKMKTITQDYQLLKEKISKKNKEIKQLKQLVERLINKSLKLII